MSTLAEELHSIGRSLEEDMDDANRGAADQRIAALTAVDQRIAALNAALSVLIETLAKAAASEAKKAAGE